MLQARKVLLVLQVLRVRKDHKVTLAQQVLQAQRVLQELQVLQALLHHMVGLGIAFASRTLMEHGAAM